MENCRPHRRAIRRQVINSQEEVPRQSMKRRASDSYYPDEKRYRSHDGRLTSCDEIQRSHDTRLRLHNEKSHDNKLRSHDDRFRSHDESNVKARRSSLAAFTATDHLPPRYQERAVHGSLRRKAQAVVPSNTPSTTLSSTSFSFSSIDNSQPFYYTMQPENEYVAMSGNVNVEKHRSLRRRDSDRCTRKPPLAPNTTKQSAASSSAMCFETSLVSSDTIYDTVFTPKAKLPRTSTLKSEQLGGAKKQLCQQPSVSTIVSQLNAGVRTQPDGESVVSDSLSQRSVHHCKQGHTLETNRGKLKVAIYHNQNDMLVHIVSVKNIQRKTKKKSIVEVFVYVKVAVVTSKGQVLYSQTTRPTRCTKMAQIHELFTFDPHWKMTGDCRLLITVFKKTTRNELVGCMSFGFNTLFETKKNINGWYYLLDEVLGQSKHLAVKTKTGLAEEQCMDRPNTILPWITLQRVTLKRSPDGKYGFTVLDTIPVQVGSVEKGSTAAASGLRKGDAFLELGGANVAGVKSRSLAEILKRANGDIQALIQRTGDRSQRPLPAPPLQTHTAPSKIKHKNVKAIAKAKAKAATLRRVGGHNTSPRSLRDRPRSLPLIEQRLKRELAAKLAARKARGHLQNSRKRNQKDMVLEKKEEEEPIMAPVFIKPPQNDDDDDDDDEKEEDVYENSPPEGYYLVPMSQDGSDSEDSSPEAEYATIHHSNRTSTALVTPGVMSIARESPPPPPPPPPPDQQFQQDLQQKQNIESVNNNIYEQTPNNLPIFAKDNLIITTLPAIEEAPLPDLEELENKPKLVKSASENSETVYENDTNLHLALCKVSSSDFGHVYENLDEQNAVGLDEIPDDIPLFVEPEMERIVEGASLDTSQERSSGSVSMQSVGSFESGASEYQTPPSTSVTDESMSVEDAELTCDNVVSDNLVWAKGVKPFRLDKPGRDLIHVGRLFINTKKKKLREMLVILFSDMLVFCKPMTDGRLKVLYRPLLINDVSILDFKRKIAREFCIKLVAGVERHPVACMCNSLIFRAPSAKLKNVWKKLLQQRLMAVKCNNDTLKPKGLDGKRQQQVAIVTPQPCSTMASCSNPAAGVDIEGVTTAATSTDQPALQNKITGNDDANNASSDVVPSKEEDVVKPCEKEGNSEGQCSVRTKCEGGSGCAKPKPKVMAKPIKKTKSAPSMEENKIKRMMAKSGSSGSEDKSEVEYENMDIVRKLRAALNTSNSNHNNRKILDASVSTQSSPALQHNPIERITMSAPSSPAMKAPLQSLQRRLLHRHSSPSRSPTKESNSDSSTKPRRRGLFKRLSGGNRTEVVTAKGSRTLSLEEREAQKKKSIEAQQVSKQKIIVSLSTLFIEYCYFFR